MCKSDIKIINFSITLSILNGIILALMSIIAATTYKNAVVIPLGYIPLIILLSFALINRSLNRKRLSEETTKLESNIMETMRKENDKSDWQFKRL